VPIWAWGLVPPTQTQVEHPINQPHPPNLASAQATVKLRLEVQRKKTLLSKAMGRGGRERKTLKM